jgi:hypothetical protein
MIVFMHLAHVWRAAWTPEPPVAWSGVRKSVCGFAQKRRDKTKS